MEWLILIGIPLGCVVGYIFGVNKGRSEGFEQGYKYAMSGTPDDDLNCLK